jgi:hypothetical protein
MDKPDDGDPEGVGECAGGVEVVGAEPAKLAGADPG